MSAEAEVSAAIDKPVDQNAQSAEDVKKMLAELEGEAQTKDTSKASAVDSKSEEKTNGDSTESKEETTEVREDKKVEISAHNRRGDRDSDDRGRYGRSDRGGRGGRGNFRGGRGGPRTRSHRDNIKSDLTTQEESSDPVAIRKQVEFYFSDANLPRDQFLLGKVGGSKNNSVELKILHTFKRMRHFQPFDAIVDAMKESKILDVVENEEGDACVQRKEPLPKELDHGPDKNAIQIFEDRAMPRSVYVKGFGQEIPSTQFDIEAFFAPFGPTNAVRLRRTEDKLFKSSVFVEFETEEVAKKFLETDPKPQFDGKELQIMSKKEYCDKKVDDIKAGKIKPNTARGGRRDDRRGGRDFKRKRDDEDDRDWRTRREEDRKNGFRDDRRKSTTDRDSRGEKAKFDKVERDERGVPVIKETEEGEDNKFKRDAQRADAIAKAKSMVDAENAKQKTVDDVEVTEQDGDADVKTDAANKVEDSIKADVEATTGTKRAREDDEGDAEREVKKVDTKGEAVEAS